MPGIHGITGYLRPVGHRGTAYIGRAGIDHSHALTVANSCLGRAFCGVADAYRPALGCPAFPPSSSSLSWSRPGRQLGANHRMKNQAHCPAVCLSRNSLIGVAGNCRRAPMGLLLWAATTRLAAQEMPGPEMASLVLLGQGLTFRPDRQATVLRPRVLAHCGLPDLRSAARPRHARAAPAVPGCLPASPPE